MPRTLRGPSCERKGRNVLRMWSHSSTREKWGPELVFCAFSQHLVSVAAHESGNNGEDTKFLYLAVADFCTQRSVGRQTGSISPDKCLRLKGHSASCGHSGAGVRFAVNFKGEF